METGASDQIFNILFNNDEITWQSMIYDLVSSEQMDPWDVDVSLLSQKFLEKLKKFREMDLKVSGKVLLAAAILLRVKSTRFIDEDITALDALFASAHQAGGDVGFEDIVDYEGMPGAVNLEEKPSLFPRTPQPRKRKVSVFDLVNALEKALEVYQRRPSKAISNAPEVRVPEKFRDMGLMIRDVYNRIVAHFKSKSQKQPKLTFNLLLPEQTKEDKVFTFVPLLHLDNQRKIDLLQQEHFGEIEISLLEKNLDEF
ncbi:MAG: segregation/condensation protein A [Nanoarchaeota archaeon]|nr:segregation/condensation protein A [Nanoarchaeota archaeon]